MYKRQAQNRIATGRDPKPMASGHPNLVPYRAFEASDGWFVLAVGSDHQWHRASVALDIEENANWKDNAGRVEDRSNLESRLAAIFIQRTRSHWEEKLSGLPIAPVNTIGQALGDQQSAARGAIWKIDGVDTLANPLRGMSLTPARPRSNTKTSFRLE